VRRLCAHHVHSEDAEPQALYNMGLKGVKVQRDGNRVGKEGFELFSNVPRTS
jgi:hypothetical protein